MDILIAPDKFKGTFTAEAAAKAMAEGWKQTRPGDRLKLLPISDGGDGFGLVLGKLLRAGQQAVITRDAAGRPCQSSWWWEAQTKTAIIESAQTIGLAMLPTGKFHPFTLDTFGLGGVLQAAIKKGAWRCVIGVGGSATNDGGFGVARALGWQFYDANGELITSWPKLINLKKVVSPKQSLGFRELIVAVDVQNPLLGKRGCSRIYGPQKGLRPKDFARAEQALVKLAEIVSLKWAAKRGAGAAGGLAFGLGVFLGGRLESGFRLFAEEAKLNSQLPTFDLVLTGEGALDHSTLMGKGVGELALMALKAGVPTWGFGGRVTREKTKKLFPKLYGLTEITSEAEAHKNPAKWLRQLAAIAAGEISESGLNKTL